MTNTAIISDPFGFNAKRVPTNGAARSWVVNGRGSASIELLNSDLVRLGLNDELRGHWVEIDDDDAGLWGGIITDAQANGDGTSEIAAEDYRALFNAIRTPTRARAMRGPAGTLALALVSESTRSIGTRVRARTADDLGTSFDLSLTGNDLRAELDSLADISGQEWWIKPDTLAMRWGRKGSDKTGRVQLIEGRHFTDWRLPETIEPIYNDIRAIPSNSRASLFDSIFVEDAESIAAVGVRQQTITIERGSYGIHIRATALAALAEAVASGRSIEGSVLNVDRCFASFAEGDTISILLASVSARVYVRVLARSLDERNVMQISGKVVSREVLA